MAGGDRENEDFRVGARDRTEKTARLNMGKGRTRGRAGEAETEGRLCAELGQAELESSAEDEGVGGAQMLAAMQVEASLGRYKLGCELGLRWQLENTSSTQGDSGRQGTGGGEPTSRKEASQRDLCCRRPGRRALHHGRAGPLCSAPSRPTNDSLVW